MFAILNSTETLAYEYDTCISFSACNCDKGKGAENLYGFCDINTGQCCKLGGNCTLCPENYILTPQGCEYCGECVGRLLNTATNLDHNLTLALKSLKQGTAGIIAESRFSSINETLQRYGISHGLCLFLFFGGLGHFQEGEGGLF